MTFRHDPNLIHRIKFDVTQHTDHLGSPVSGTDAVGDVVWRERYTPFGEKQLGPSQLDNQAAFTGHIYDEKTGLTYMQARYYDPAIGRFLSIDPVNIHQTGVPAQFNRYSYAGNNPVLWTDPNGECPWCVVIAVIYVADKAYGAYDAYKTAEAVANGEMSAVDAAIEQGESQAAAVVFGPAGRAVAKGRQKLSKASKATKAGDCCFVAGTLVETKDGLKPIETLKEGDQVLSRNPETGETAYKAVTAFIPRHQRVIWTVELSGGEGFTEFFETTDEHPWWIVDDLNNGRWLRTDELQVGMTVTTADNQTMTIDSVIETDRVDGTYNITVADFETYFVGENRVLVHNCPAYGEGTRRSEYGNPSSSPAAREARANGEGQPCPNCGETMKSGTNTSPQAQHDPASSDHYNEHGGQAMTAEQRKEYARSPESLNGANCATCQRSEGGKQRNKYRKK